MRLLEIVRGDKTSKSVVATVDATRARRSARSAVLVGVCYGFVGNRMLAARQREAQKLILEGAMPWDVDRVLYDFGMPMGPFAMGDLAGLDIGWSKETTNVLDDPRDPVRAWTGAARRPARASTTTTRTATPGPRPSSKKSSSTSRRRRASRGARSPMTEILERCIYPMINEGAKILEEGKAQRACDIDIVWINGYGWPVYRGGPMFYGDSVGLDKVLARLKDFQASMGDEFKPAALLEKLAAEGKTFGAR